MLRVPKPGSGSATSPIPSANKEPCISEETEPDSSPEEYGTAQEDEQVTVAGAEMFTGLHVSSLKDDPTQVKVKGEEYNMIQEHVANILAALKPRIKSFPIT